MKVLGINGSPREGGNTDAILKMAFEPLQEAGIETEIVRIGGQGIRGCTACMACFRNRNKRCIIETDMLNEVVARFDEVDGIVLGSPTYFADVTADIKAFMDRAGFVSNANGGMLRHKAGASVTAVRRGGAIHTLDSMNHWLHYMQTFMVGSSYWNMVYCREPGEAASDAEGVKTMRNLGLNMAHLLGLMRLGKEEAQKAATSSPGGRP
jgi:multimeric flavodoxin WrbA